nr:hypothetical protein [uncultured bacterium]
MGRPSCRRCLSLGTGSTGFAVNRHPRRRIADAPKSTGGNHPHPCFYRRPRLTGRRNGILPRRGAGWSLGRFGRGGDAGVEVRQGLSRRGLAPEHARRIPCRRVGALLREVAREGLRLGKPARLRVCRDGQGAFRPLSSQPNFEVARLFAGRDDFPRQLCVGAVGVRAGGRPGAR